MTQLASDFTPIQQESIQFNNPVSQSAATALGAAINGLLSILTPVGTIVPTMLTESQFQTQLGNTNWVLCNGQSCAGSAYATLTSNTTVPDARGLFLRGQSGSSGNNPDGNLPLGTYQADQFGSHNHNFNDPGHTHAFNQNIGLRLNNYFPQTTLSAYDTTFTGTALSLNNNTTGVTILSNGGNETRAKNITVNYMIRIN